MRTAIVHAALLDPSHRIRESLRIRVGIAAGEPIERNGDFFGSTVQLAARLCAQAAPGQTLVSSSVAELCGQRQLIDLGDLTLKGFPHAVRAHAVVEEAQTLGAEERSHESKQGPVGKG